MVKNQRQQQVPHRQVKSLLGDLAAASKNEYIEQSRPQGKACAATMPSAALQPSQNILQFLLVGSELADAFL